MLSPGQIRRLQPGDEPSLDRFLRRHADSSLFLRSNSLAAGLRDEGRPLHATYWASFDGDQITGVVAHAWNGNLLLQAPSEVGLLARAAALHTGRPIAGILGPWDQVCSALTELDLNSAPFSMRSREDLFALDLDALRVPTSLSAGDVACRRATSDDIELLTTWRREYRLEALGEADSPELITICRAEVTKAQSDASTFVLAKNGSSVATCSFNATHPECVQIGGVWTPPDLRSRGFARAVVAGALLAARRQRVSRSVLFTGEHNVAARATYASLGYQRVGDYGLVLFREGQRLAALRE